MRRLRAWLHGLRYRTCSTCNTEFRRFPCTMPSLVGFAYCSTGCEKKAWDDWCKGTPDMKGV